MIAILINVLAVLVGSAVGALAKRGITEKYITVLNTAMGLAALVLGVNVALTNMPKSHFPALFIFCLALGGLLGTVLRLDERSRSHTPRVEDRKQPHRRYHHGRLVLLCRHALHDGPRFGRTQGR